MVTGATTRDQIADIAADALGCQPADLTDNVRFEKFGGDSLDCFEIVMRVEDDCAVTITQAQAGRGMRGLWARLRAAIARAVHPPRCPHGNWSADDCFGCFLDRQWVGSIQEQHAPGGPGA